MSVSSAASRSLLRRWKSVPLPGLTQGSTLTITSTLTEPAHIVIQPEWRDTGHVELVQQLVSSKKPLSATEVEMTITREEDLKTSLGRYEPHISIRLSPPSIEEIAPLNFPSASAPDSATVRHYLPSKKVDKVILDDGSVHPDAQEYLSPPLGMKRVEYHDGLAHITQSSSCTDDCSDGSGASTSKQERKIPSARTSTLLTIQVPEQLNVNCDLQEVNVGGSISVRGKLEGDVKLKTCRGGNISVTKLRGHAIELVSTGGDDEDDEHDCGPSWPIIFAKDLVEAQSLTISTTGRVRAKQIHGRSVNIHIDRQQQTKTHDDASSGRRRQRRVEAKTDGDDEGSLVDISALFVSGGGDGGGASIQVTTTNQHQPLLLARRAVRVKSHHGALEVVATSLPQPTEIDPYTHQTYPLVELGGVNGSCEVMIQDTTAALSASDEEWNSCRVHVDSLMPDSVSLITSDQGNTSLTLDRKAECDLRLLSTSNADCLLESGAMLAEEEDSKLLLHVLRHVPEGPVKSLLPKGQPRISVETKAFTCTARTMESEEDTIAYREGYVENKSHEPDSRFDRRSRGEGKIRLDGAAAQALQSFSKQHSVSDDNVDDESVDNKLRPLVAVASTGRITVETVSWIGAIARRYGLDDSHRGVGRTASRRGRSFAPSDDYPY